MYKVVIGVHNNIHDKDIQYQSHVRSITYFSLIRLSLSDKVNIDQKYIERNNIEDIFIDSYNTGAKWLFLTSYGLNITDVSIIDKCIQHAEENDCGIVGHPLQVNYPDKGLGENEFLLHPQCLLVNLKVWKKLGKPKFGERTTESFLKHIPLRSEENIHDDYTPLWIKPSGKKEEHEGYLDTGWSLIQAAMEGGESILAFPDSIKNSKSYFYPDSKSDIFEKLLEGSLDEDKFIKENKSIDHTKTSYIINTSFKHHKHRVYIFNSDDNDTIEQDKDSPILDNLYSTASGFKVFKLLQSSNWNKNTKIGFYDYSKASLNLKKWLIKNWDGVDYISALNYYKYNAVCECCDAPIKSTYQWTREVDIVDDEDLLRDKFNSLVEEFGGMENWLNLWNKFKKLDHKFLLSDVLGDFSSITDHMKKNKGTNLIWLSNIFFSEPIIRNFRPNVVEEKYDILINQLNLNSSDITILGAAPLSKQVYDEHTQ